MRSTLPTLTFIVALLSPASLLAHPDPVWVATFAPPSALFGSSALGVGDVNGDGFDDVAAGASRYTNGQDQEGAAFLYLGSASGPSLLADWQVESHGAGAHFGEVDGAGDVNGDGFADVLVSARDFSTTALRNTGRAYLYLGSAAGLPRNSAWRATGTIAQAGLFARGAGDANGDGFDDVVVNEGEFPGTARLHLGSAAGPLAAAAWTATDGRLRPSGDPVVRGFHATRAGDLNGDGFGDLAAAAITSSETGGAYVYLGSRSGPSTNPSWTFQRGSGSPAEFVYTVAALGDVNGDGYDDLAVSGLEADSRRPESLHFIYLGGREGVNDGRRLEVSITLGPAGDVNGDGIADVASGLNVYLGSPQGPVLDRAAWLTDAPEGSSRFLAPAGDVDHDGLDDVLASVPGIEVALYGPLCLEEIVDNPGPGTSSTGSWSSSGSPGAFGKGSVWARRSSSTAPVPTFTFTADLVPGEYGVFEWHSVFATRSRAARHQIQHAAGTATVIVDQSVKGGQWNLLGVHTFSSPARVTIRAEDTARSTNADAIRFVCKLPESPVAVIDGITGDLTDAPVCFAGHGEARVPIVAYEWILDGDPGTIRETPSFCTELTQGTHEVSFRVEDAFGTWSPPVERMFHVTACADSTRDDRDSGNARTGSWQVSTAPGAHAGASLWSRPSSTGPVTFTFKANLHPGTYEVLEWHSIWSTRTRAARHVITHGGGTAVKLVDQSVKGGQWNSLGTYAFSGASQVTIHAEDPERSTNADAIRFRCLGP